MKTFVQLFVAIWFVFGVVQESLAISIDCHGPAPLGSLPAPGNGPPANPTLYGFSFWGPADFTGNQNALYFQENRLAGPSPGISSNQYNTNFAMTGSNKDYLGDHLLPGHYHVRFTVKPGFRFWILYWVFLPTQDLSKVKTCTTNGIIG